MSAPGVVDHPPSHRFIEAVALAIEIHGPQERKGLGVTYLSHVLGVAATVWEYGGDEDVAIAALLHDAVEDGGGQPMRDRIVAAFGERVAELVVECSDSITDDPTHKSPWFERKVRHLDAMRSTSDDAIFVSAADKLHNARAILADHHAVGDELWSRFNPAAGPAGVVWYYRRLQDVIVPRLAVLGGRRAQLGNLFARTIDELAASVRRGLPDLDEQVMRRQNDAQALR